MLLLAPTSSPSSSCFAAACALQDQNHKVFAIARSRNRGNVAAAPRLGLLRWRRRCRAAAEGGAAPPAHQGSPPGGRHVAEIPLFPLPLVLFPGAILPLQIFELRYRIMMHTLLHTDLCFGIVYTDRSSGMAAVGCVGHVIKHERLVDDRFFLICRGQRRFRVISLVRATPYLVAHVEWLDDCRVDGAAGVAGDEAGEPGDPAADEEEALAADVEGYMRDVIRLSNRMNKKGAAPPADLRKGLQPAAFSFWVASTFEGAPNEQQALLELEDTALRLRREKETLRNTLNYLTAAAAVKDVFSSPNSNNE